MKEEEQLNKNQEIKKGIITFLLFLFFPTIYQVILYYPFTHSNNILKALLLLIQEILLTVALFYIQKDKFTNAWKDFKKNKKEYLDIMFKSWILGFIIMAVSNLFINVILKNGIAANEETNRMIMKAFALYAIPAIMILGPICEELTFRASLKKVINNKIIYIAVTSFLFAGAHIYGNISSIIDLLYLIPYGSLGVAMGYTYSKTDNILTNIFIHMFHNSLSVLAIISIL